MSNERTGKALMKAVAEAVGWQEYATYQPLDWNWVILACEAAGIKHLIINWSSKSTQIVYEWSNEAWVKVKGTSPESLCRALLAAIEARK